MRVRRKTMVLLAAALLATLAFCIFIRSNEPAYAGRPLSYWVILYHPYHGGADSQRKRAAEAIRQIGTNAVPYLLTWVQNEEPLWMLRLRIYANHLRGRPDRAPTVYNTAPYAFHALDPETRGAFEALTQMLNQPGTNNTQIRAAYALAYLGGPRALPLFLATLTNAQPHMRRAAARALGELGTNAQSATPALLNALNDPDDLVRSLATNTLRKITPEVLTNAPAK